ncbi:C25 family cysteine peptidase [Hymenobacter sp. CRA2]|uniref:putative type IX secretion system sortase PorU2 n=1 Tax=Hymenobacter sp. CRA2 TaxID=1955620 RepID=UPI00098FA608|nr:C25 family cysteine peptidase [Hymenobacter sp. CRA2]OON68628.1 hypothetical protein B0919_13400 [Hymenobacter sp. CRA2]
MSNKYTRVLSRWSWVLWLVLVQVAAQAQSGPYGNEWIVPSQTYYKIKVTQDGIYRLDYNYLTRAGITGVSPQRLQLWRRGQQVARYIGGNRAQLDATTYVEFYGQRNDGKLDRDMYKAPGDQPHQLYSLFTDTAAYFLTWSATANGRDMAEPATSAATAHPNWINEAGNVVGFGNVFIYDYMYGQNHDGILTNVPWADTGEGFLSGFIGRRNFSQPDPNEQATFSVDGVDWITAVGATPQLEVRLVGEYAANHVTNISVTPDGSTTSRLVGTARYANYTTNRFVFPLQRSDIGNNGVVKVTFAVDNAAANPRDRFSVGYIRVRAPQLPQWLGGTRTSFAFLNDSTLATPAYYELNNAPATLLGYDVTDPTNVQRVQGLALNNGRRGYAFPSAAGRTRRLLLADGAQTLQPAPAQRTTFRVLTPAQSAFLIVSSKALMQPVGSVANPVRAYANYRASTAGGRHDTLVVTSDLLYDQFHYGERSPLAVKHFVNYMLTAPRTDRYLLLLGRGVLITEGTSGGFYRQSNAAQRATLPPDLVPASTRGASDLFFTADWQRDDFVPRIPTGRIAARTPQQVVDYLSKLQEHETPGIKPWAKNILHLAGGQEPGEFALFQSYLRNFQKVAEGPFFGANVENIYNTTTGGNPVVINIAPQVNRGLSLITYFGHASPQYLNLMPTNILDPSNGYANRGKYPVWVALGCAAGNAFTSESSIGEDWTLVANKGSVGFLSNSDFTLDNDDSLQGQRLYEALFSDPQWYGKPVAAVQAEVNRRMMPLLPSPSATYAYRFFLSTIMNTIWQGDPALTLYAPAKPDYQFTAGTTSVSVVSLGSGPVLANSPTFGLRLQISNPGKVIRTPLQITVARQIGSNPATTQPFTIPFFRRDTTVTLTLTNPNGVNVFGRNVFTVKLDDPNVIDELNEGNNTGTTDFNFLNGGVTILNPTEFAIVGKTNVRLVAQSNLVQSQPVAYELELDTIPTFSSPLRRTTVQALDVVEWRPGLPAPAAGRDSVVYYWRVRFAASTGLDQTWTTSSFRLISNSPGGWSQSHYGQMAANDKRNLVQAVPSGRWDFAERTRRVELQTAGGGDGSAATFQFSYGIRPDGNSVRVNNCGIDNSPVVYQPNIMAAVFDGRTLRQYNNLPGGPYQLCGEVGSTTYFHFASGDGRTTASTLDDVNTPQRQAQLLALLRNIPAGAYVALVSMNRVNFSTLNPQVKQELANLGSQLINSAQDGDPLVMLLHKGFPNDRQEATFDPGSATPRSQQVVSLNGAVRTREGAGTVVSTRVGPALQWQTLYHTVKLPEATDSYTLRLVGYDQSNTRTVLNANVTSRNFSLSGISAQQYPYLQLEAELRDTTNRTPPQLKQWLITYRGMPEGVVRRDHPSIPAGAYSSATLSAAAASAGYLNIPVYFENVSSNDFTGRTRALITVSENRNGGVRDTFSVRSSAARLPGADSTAFFNFARVDVRRYSGDVTVRVDANSRQLPELITYNNTLNLSFTAPSVTVPPVLDVAFDGQHILNGDIVSASPEILVDVKYEDKRRPIKDPTRVQVYLTRPGSAVAQQIDMTNQSLIRFVSDTVAGRFRVYYTPGTLPDGVYKLEAQAKDMADNPVAAQRFAVTFEVINQASITNVFPYPNPVTSKARFVFTLTGASPPRNMKIQILTLSGKVVKEIMQAELGNVRVGNNITDYAWDGTDQYGDQLANGTYLYRVVLDDPESEYKHRRTAADQAFKKGWGKLVLLR